MNLMLLSLTVYPSLKKEHLSFNFLKLIILNKSFNFNKPFRILVPDLQVDLQSVNIQGAFHLIIHVALNNITGLVYNGIRHQRPTAATYLLAGLRQGSRYTEFVLSLAGLKACLIL